MAVLVAVVGAVFVFVIIVALQAVFYREEEEEKVSKVYSMAPEELSRLRAAQQEALHSYRWVDQAQGRVAIPIDRAMDLTVIELRGRTGSEARPASTSPSGHP